MGMDCVAPFLARSGAFALVRTSNPGSDEVQAARLTSGETIAQHIAVLVAREGATRVGSRGYSSLGAVVGATKAADAAALRQLMKAQLFLVPGYGAQGGSVADVIPCFHEDGRGAIVTASRSVIYPESAGGDWMGAIARAARQLAREVGDAVIPSRRTAARA